MGESWSHRHTRTRKYVKENFTGVERPDGRLKGHAGRAKTEKASQRKVENELEVPLAPV